MPLLRLTPDEAGDLKLALDVRLHALRVEIGCTETHDYRMILRHRLERLEAIAARLDTEAGRADRPPHS